MLQFSVVSQCPCCGDKKQHYQKLIDLSWRTQNVSMFSEGLKSLTYSEVKTFNDHVLVENSTNNVL